MRRRSEPSPSHHPTAAIVEEDAASGLWRRSIRQPLPLPTSADADGSPAAARMAVAI